MKEKKIREKLRCPKCGYKQTYYRKRDDSKVCPKCGHIERLMIRPKEEGDYGKNKPKRP